MQHDNRPSVLPPHSPNVHTLCTVYVNTDLVSFSIHVTPNSSHAVQFIFHLFLSLIKWQQSKADTDSDKPIFRHLVFLIVFFLASYMRSEVCTVAKLSLPINVLFVSSGGHALFFYRRAIANCANLKGLHAER